MSVDRRIFSEIWGRREDLSTDMALVNQLQFLRIFRPSSEMMRLEVEGFMRAMFL